LPSSSDGQLIDLGGRILEVLYTPGHEDGKVSFSLADAAAYRTKGASKATPGFDVIDYGQEDYVFGDSDSNARHWSVWVLKALQENADVLETLFNQ
jgi:hypothetical protein